MSNARLLISDLRYAYVTDSGKAVDALAKVDITLQPRDFVSLIGPSGCGKSTLFNIIAGLLLPDQGEVKLDGADIVGRPGSVAYMMQRDLLLPWRTVLENVTLAPEIAGKSMAQVRAEARSLLRVLGLRGSKMPIRRHYRAACGSVRRSSAPSCANVRSFCSTSRLARWMR